MVDIWPPPVSRRIDLAEEPAFDLGAMRVIPAERTLVMNGQRGELQPRVMQVLVALAKARPEVLSRDKLIEMCWDGRIVGDDALNRCILALRHHAQQFTPQPFAIDTVPRIGHRLIEGPAEDHGSEPVRTGRPWQLASAAAALLILVTSGIFVWQRDVTGDDPATIAVLPFRNLSSGDPYFAEGIGEEILGQLAREPEFRVAGRTTAAQVSKEPDPRKLGKALGVEYLLEGSVRSDRGRVRINASLMQTRDGARLWSETYDRKLEDILEIQASIGQAVAGELRRRLVHSPTRRAVNGEAYALYLNARGLLRSQSPAVGAEAVSALQRSVKLDPGYAPAWASLAEAINLDGRSKGVEPLIAALPQAQAAARRALQIDPNLAEAHGALGQLLGAETSAGVAHLRRAAELAPRTGEGLVWRGLADAVTDDFAAALAAKKRAHELDPEWPFPVRAMVDLTAELGDRSDAETIVRAGFPADEMTQHFAFARIAWFLGDFSEAARHYAIVAKSPGRWARPAQRSLDDLRFMLGLSPTMPNPSPVANVGSFSRYVPRVWLASAPSAAEWQRHNRSAAAALVYQDENIVAAKLMLNAGRARELVATFDGPTGLLGLRRGQQVGPCQFQEVPLVASALRAVGRNGEADAVLRQAVERLGAAYRRGRVPVWFEGDAAAVWSVQGRKDLAFAALDRAVRRGWVYGGRIDLPSFSDEPAFRSLHSDPRFKTVQTKIAAHFSRERAETQRALAALA